MQSMEDAHRQDYADQAKMRQLRAAIDTFLADPPNRAHTALLARLRLARGELKAGEDHIVAVWD